MGGGSGGSKNSVKGGAEASSSFIANTHNEIYAFYTGKGSLL